MSYLETLVPQQAPQATPTAEWRLLEGFGLSGAANMALDEALLESVIAGGPPAVRFYTWDPATLSLGVNQPVGEIDRDACDALGFNVVRRITGGRAVLHQHEITYSVIARENDPRVSGGVVESYRKISSAIIAGLQTLGADVALAPPARAGRRSVAANEQEAASGDRALKELADREHGAVCFDATSAYELTAGGRKLVGSAQARRGGALLQHGSILLDIDWDAWVQVFSYASEAGRQRAYQKLPTRMTSLSQELGRRVSPQEVYEALRPAFAEVMRISLEPAALTPDEEHSAKRLVTEKYASEAWTARQGSSGASAMNRSVVG